MEDPSGEFHRRLAPVRARAHGHPALLVVIALGTMGFGMAEVLGMEPYGGQVLDLVGRRDHAADGSDSRAAG